MFSSPAHRPVSGRIVRRAGGRLQEGRSVTTGGSSKAARHLRPRQQRDYCGRRDAGGAATCRPFRGGIDQYAQVLLPEGTSRTHQAGRPPHAAANPHSRCRAISPVVRWPGRAAARRLRSDRECAHRHPLRQDRHRLRHGDHPRFHHDLATKNLRTAQCLVANRTRAAATSADIVAP
jgi:hypothetical protein